MKQTFKRGVSFVLAFMMVFGVFATMPFTAFAANDYTINSTESTDDYYNLISKKDWEIAPGITESEIVLNNDDGSQRQVLFVMEADLNNEYVKVINSYTGMVPQHGNYKVGVMSEQAKLAEELGYGNVVGAMNTTLSWYTGYAADRVNEPLGFIMLDAEILFDPANCGYVYGNVGFPSVLVINKDFDENGNPRPADIPKVEMPQIRSAADLHGWEDQVIPCSSGYIVKDGVNPSKPSHIGGAPRSVVGIKADGTVVIMVNDGRQAPYSEGMSMYELAEVMLDLGCTYAVNCDGGGSTTWLSQRPGEELKVNNSPSDGSERATTTGILFISTAPATGEFVRATINTSAEYYTPGSEVKFEAIGTDLVGTMAEIPADAVWQLSDSSFGTISNDGVFKSNGKEGKVTAQLVYNGEVRGEKEISIVWPTDFAFASAGMTIPFGKTVAIELVATYNGAENYVELKVEDIQFALSDSTLGTISDFYFTSNADENASVISGTLTATINGMTAITAINLGKGSEVIFDFEGEDPSKDWFIYDYNVTHSGNSSNPNWDMKNELIEVVTPETGKVHSGNSALAVTVDYSDAYSNGWLQYRMGYTGEYIELKNAKRLGFWIWMPEEVYAGEWDLHIRCIDANGNPVKLGPVLTDQGYSIVGQDEAGWRYFTADISQYPITYFGYYPDSTVSTALFYIQFYNQQQQWQKDDSVVNTQGKYTYFIDDITVEYSDAADDADAPVFGTLNLIDNNGVMSEMKGQNINYNTFGAEVSVSDFVKGNATGIDASSAKAYVDGVEVDCKYASGRISISNITVADGLHSVKFVICDKMGNLNSVIRQIRVNAGSNIPTVNLVPHDTSLTNLLSGSVYYVDIVASNIESAQKIVVDLDMVNTFIWHLDHAIVADGFEMSYELEKYENVATITITKTGNASASGSQVVASVPVRVWEAQIDRGNLTSSLLKEVWLTIKSTRGFLECTDGTVSTFTCDPMKVATELWMNQWNAPTGFTGVTLHKHTVVALDDKAANCTEAGYMGRTYCAVCDSVVDWGTIVNVQGHTYDIVDGKLTCVVGGELFNGVYTDGKTYVDGVAMLDGWNADNTAYYKDGVKLTGSHLINGVMCTFDENGVYLPNYIYDGWYIVGNTAMFFMSNEYLTGYQKVNSQPHFFDDNGMGYDGEYTIDGKVCVFDNGRFVSCEDETVLEAGWFGSTENVNGLHSVEYVVYEDASICITGSGNMMNVAEVGLIPWSAYVQKFIKTIFIAKDITNIGHHSFRNCFFATTVVFEDGSKVTEIGACAFYNMRSLKSIVLSENVKIIGSNAFGQTYNLTEVYLPDGVQTINSRAFVKSNADLVLNVAEGTIAHSFAVNNGFDVELREKKPVLVATGECGEKLVWSYYANGKLVIEGSGAMYDFANRDAQPWAKYREQITCIEIGKEVTYLGTYAFAYSYNVKAITFAEDSKLQSIGSFAIFYMYRNLTELALPESVATLAGQAIGYNSVLVNVYMPQRIKSISAYTFLNSKNVVLNVAEGSYAETFAVKNGIAYDTREYVYSVIDSGFCGTNVTWTYYEDGKLVISGSGAMDDFANRDAQPWAKYREQITNIVIGKDIVHLGKYAFAYSYNVRSVTFEEGSKLQSINSFAIFYMYRYLTDLQLPETVRTIAGQAFGYNNVLVDVYMPQSVTSIATNAFLNSKNVIMNVVEGTYAENFAINNNIAYITRAYTEQPITEGNCGINATWAFYANGKLVISGSGAMDDFANRDAQPWAVFREQITDIVIGKDIIHIGKYAFAYAYNVKSITFEEDSKLESIGALSIYYMHRYLTEIVLPESVKTISGQAFGYNSNLVNVYMPESLTSIAANAFVNSKKVVLNVVEGSYAEIFAKDNDISYEVE